MSNTKIHPDDVQLEPTEEAMKFNRYWTDERLEKAKLLAKRLVTTDFDAVEQYGMMARQKPEHKVVVTPSEEHNDNRPTAGYHSPPKSSVHIDARSDFTIWRVRDNKFAPDE